MAQNRIESAVKQYLKMSTSYAILINGKRGIGKTFLIKNKILNLIKEIPVFSDHSKKYIPVFISLYGFNSINDVYSSIAVELMPFIKGKEVNITLALGKLFTRGLMGINKMGNPDDYINDLKIVTKNIIDIKNFVLIFDDLDRISAKLGVNEFVGFVNSLVEHDNNKIIIIADNSEIKDTQYNAVVEKTIGTTIEYTSSFSENYDEIIEGYKFGQDDEYYKYLAKYKDEIINIFNLADNYNLRTLTYLLQHLKIVFGYVYDCLDLANPTNNDNKQSVLKYIIQFCTIITIEFKHAGISYTERRNIDGEQTINEILYNSFLHDRFGDKKKDAQVKVDSITTENYAVLFLKKYPLLKKYKFITPLYDFLTGGRELDSEELKETLEEKFTINTKPIPIELKVFEDLRFPDCYDLSNAELKDLTSKLFNFAIEGKYPLNHYLSIFNYIHRFNYILDYDLDKVKDSLITSIKQNKNKFEYNPLLEKQILHDPNLPIDIYYDGLRKVLLPLNEELRIESSKLKFSNYLELFKTDQDKFYQEVLFHYKFAPVFDYWDFDEFYQIFEQLRPTAIINFVGFIESRYNGYDSSWFENVFFQTLLDKVTVSSEHNRSLRDNVLEDLAYTINKLVFKIADKEY